MSDVRVPAVRLRAPSWRDGRLVVGVLIILSSVILGSRVVAAAGRTVPVFAAAADLPSGHPLSASDLRAVSVHLGPGTAGYLSVRRPLPEGMVLMRPIGAGELVPSGALGPPAGMTRRSVAIPVPPPLPEGLRPGAAVDLWSSAKETGPGATGYASPERIAQGAEIRAVVAAGSGLGVAGSGSAQVLLEEAQLRAVLDALANGAKIVLVPAPVVSGGTVGTFR
jgi:hypothetical protein